MFHESSSGKPASHPATAPLRKQRCRISFSCTNCRRGRQRCDRQSPCASCIRRGKQSTCQYEEAVFDSKKSQLANAQRNSYLADRPAPRVPVMKTTDSKPSFQFFGYSEENQKNNIIGMFRKLEEFDPLANPIRKKRGNIAHITPVIQEKYVSLIRELPSRPYVDYLVSIYFEEVQWQYSMLDYSFFNEQLQTFYNGSFDIFAKGQNKLQAELVFFPALLFQVLALALQFVPHEYDPMLDELRDGKSFHALCMFYSEIGVAISTLFEKENVNLMSVQEGVLRVCRMKNCGEIDNSWAALGRAIKDAQEIGLDKDNEEVEMDPNNPEGTCSKLWDIEMRRRVMLNLFLWDSEMSLVLGNTMHFDINEFTWRQPLDAHIPPNRKTNVPVSRRDSDPPSTFTGRFMEYQLMRRIPEILQLEAEGPYPKDYAKVLRMHQEALEFLENLPSIWSLKNPDKSFDAELPWLAPQREYNTSIFLYFIVALHKSYTFSIPNSRTEILKAGIAILVSQQRNMSNLRFHQYTLFTLTFLTFEPAVVMLAVLIAYPHENVELANTALAMLKQSVERLHILREGKNVLAGPGSDVLQVLLKRAEAVRGGESPESDVSTDLTTVSSLTTHASSSPPTSTRPTPSERPVTHSTTSFEDSIMAAPPPSSGAQLHQFTSLAPTPNIPIFPDANFDAAALNFPDTDYGLLVEPLQPTNSLIFQELTPTEIALGHSPHVLPPFVRAYSAERRQMMHPQEQQEQSQQQQNVGTGNQTNEEYVDGDQQQQQLQTAFVGRFAQNSFWNFLNEGM